jgi:hypothetical protein
MKYSFLREYYFLFLICFFGCREHEEDKNAKYITEYYNNGKIKSRYRIAAGQRQGIKEDFYETGVVKSRNNWVNDTLDGLAISYYENGRVQLKENYSKGKKNGCSISYDIEGRVTLLKEYITIVKTGGFEVFFKNDALPYNTELLNRYLVLSTGQKYDDNESFFYEVEQAQTCITLTNFHYPNDAQIRIIAACNIDQLDTFVVKSNKVVLPQPLPRRYSHLLVVSELKDSLKGSMTHYSLHDLFKSNNCLPSIEKY